MPAITFCLDSRRLTNADADLRYVLPDFLKSRSSGVLQDDGYGYSADNQYLLIYLNATDMSAGVTCILDLIKNTRFMGNDLAPAAIVAVERHGVMEVVYPADFQGRLPAESNPLHLFWQTEPLEILPNLHRFRLTTDSSPIPFSQVLTLWETSEPFRNFFTEILADCPFIAFRWETPPLTASTADRPFEYVLHNGPRLPATPDPHAFAEHFNAPGSRANVITFRNLGNDATLIVPTPLGTHAAYPHLAAFLRQAPDFQKHALWQLVGQTLNQQLSHVPLWLSTAGMGVAWLHIRLDTRPKYYGYVPYKSPPQ